MRTRSPLITAVVVGALILSAAPRAQQSVDETHRLAALCEVWGLLKYFHPDVAMRTDWDDVLIAAVPKIRAAATKQAFNEQVVALIGEAGLAYVFREVVVGPPRDASALGSQFRWIGDAAVFEPETSLLLKAIVMAHRPATTRWVEPAFYQAGYASNPAFTNDQAYSSAASGDYPDEATRLLALARYWNMVQYFYPDRDLMDRDWVEALPELVPRFQRAAGALDYHLTVAEMTASINDTHANTSSSVLSQYYGVNAAPLRLRLVEDRSVVTKIVARLLDPGVDLRVGDVMTHINGVPVETLRARMRTRLNGSNDAGLERVVHDRLMWTNDSHLTLTVQRGDGQTFVADVSTGPLSAVTSELGTPTENMSAILPGNVGYVHMGLLKVADVPGVMAQLRNTRAIVFDLRNYPNSTVSAVASYLNGSPKPFVKFTYPDYDHPGSFLWTRAFTIGKGSADYAAGAPPAYTYTGRVAVLVNQETQSQAEFTAMALRTAPDVRIIGSQTAGADGNVSLITLPGVIYTYFSGLGVFYPDGTPTQRIGIVPDVVVKPTIQGLRDGRDEVLEAAVQILR